MYTIYTYMHNFILSIEWMNDNLVAKFQANVVIRNGLLNPKCVDAMKLLQTDPKAAQKKFQGDAEVELFMKEFGGVMSEHFNALGEEERKKKEAEEKAAKAAAAAPRVEEIGVLQYEAEKRHQEQQRAKKNLLLSLYLMLCRRPQWMRNKSKKCFKTMNCAKCLWTRNYKRFYKNVEILSNSKSI